MWWVYVKSQIICKGKGHPNRPRWPEGFRVGYDPWIFLTLGTTRVAGRQPHAPAAFTPGEIRGTHFQRLSRPQGTWFLREEPRKKSPVTPPGIDLWTVQLVAQCLNHYATPGPKITNNTPGISRFSFCVSGVKILQRSLQLSKNSAVNRELHWTAEFLYSHW